MILNILLFSMNVVAENTLTPAAQSAVTAPEKKAPKPAAKVESGKPKVKCPEGIGAKEGDEPKLIATADHGFFYVVCGSYDPESTHKIGKKMMSEFEVYSCKKDGKLSEPIVKIGALENVAVRTRAGHLILEKYVYVPTGYYLETFRTDIVCSEEDCEQLEEKCKFEKKPRPTFTKAALKELETFVSGENKEKPFSESLLKKLIEAALSGDEKAVQFFTSDNLPNLDGDLAEQYAEFSDLFKKFKSSKCL